MSQRSDMACNMGFFEETVAYMRFFSYSDRAFQQN